MVTLSRRNALLVVASVLIFQHDGSGSFSVTVTAFSTLPLTFSPSHLLSAGRQSSHSSSSSSSSLLRYSPREAPPSPLSMTKHNRLSRSQEMDLLRQTTEMRRIQALERDLSFQNKNKLPLLSVRARAAGYGTDLDSYQAALDRGHSARETLVTHNMGLVRYAVSDILKSPSSASSRSLGAALAREDLVQEGAIGLARAVDKYNIGIGGKFSVYAMYWIRASVLRCIAEKSETVRVPEHVSAAVRKMTSAARRLSTSSSGSYGRQHDDAASPLWKEAQAAKRLAEEAGLTDRQLKEAIKVNSRRSAGSSVSFEDWMQRGQDLQSDASAHVFLTNKNSDEETVDAHKLRSQLSRFLRPKEIEALSLRYGLEKRDDSVPDKESSLPGADEAAAAPPVNYQAEAEALVFGESLETPKRKKSGELPFSEVGRQMSVSAEYGRRLVHTALAKLQKAAREGQLEPSLLF